MNNRAWRFALLLICAGMAIGQADADEALDEVGKSLGQVLAPGGGQNAAPAVEVGKGLSRILQLGGVGGGAESGVGKKLDSVLRPGQETGATVSGVGLRVALVLEQLRRGDVLDLDQALDEAALSYALAHHGELLKVTPPASEGEAAGQGVEDPSIGQAKDQLAKLWLARHGEELRDAVKGPLLIESLPLQSRLLLGAALSKRGDARCIPIYQACYLDWEKQNTDPLTGQIRKSQEGVPGVHELAWYYQAKQQWREAAEAYLLSEKYSTAPVWLCCAYIEAGRAYQRLGDEVKAREAYAKVAQFGQGLYTGIALSDQTETLLRKKQYKEALALLQQPVTGENADQIAVGLSVLLAETYYQLGDLEQASKKANEAISQFHSISTPKHDAGLEGDLNRANAILGWCEQWKKRPFTVDPPRLQIAVSQAELKQGIRKHLFVIRSREGLTLQLNVEGTTLKSQLGPKQQATYFTKQELRFDIDSNFVHNDLNTSFTVTSPQSPDFAIKVPVSIRVEPVIKSSKEILFFGTTPLNQITTRELELSSSEPFQIKKIEIEAANGEADKAQIQMKFGSQVQPEQKIEVKLTPLQQDRFYSGKLRIYTNIAEQEVVEVPYAAYAK